MRCRLKGDVIFVVAAVLLIGLSGWYAFFDRSTAQDEQAANDAILRSRRVRDAEPGKIKKQQVRRKRQKQEAVQVVAERRGAKPSIDLEKEEEAELTAQHRQLLADIRGALDADNKKKMIALIQKMQKLDEWPDGIPTILKKTAIEAMAWFGADCLPELAGFFADNDPEIVSDVVSQYEDALSDPDLSQEQIAQLLVVASQYVHDADAMDSMLTSFNELSHSLAVSTIKTIMEVGTDETKQVLPDNIDFYTGEENLHTPEALDEWLEKHPDEHDDQVIE